MAGHFLKSAESDCVVVGADRVAANGDVANKIGTYFRRGACERKQVPFYVAAPISTWISRSSPATRYRSSNGLPRK